MENNNLAAAEKATKDFEKEHVFEYIITSHPEKFKIITVKNKNIFHSNSLRLTLDTRDDYTFLCTVYDFLYKKSHFFNIYDIARLIRNKPWLLFINQHIMQKKI